jgi:hypothetical protein
MRPDLLNLSDSHGGWCLMEGLLGECALPVAMLAIL